jgi:hypothetical protein
MSKYSNFLGKDGKILSLFSPTCKNFKFLGKDGSSIKLFLVKIMETKPQSIFAAVKRLAKLNILQSIVL